MKSVGIKVLKNNLSRYLDLVRKGELVLITDRDEVIAELRRPSRLAQGQSRTQEYLDEQARAGKLILATRSDIAVPKRGATQAIDIQALLDDTRADRS